MLICKDCGFYAAIIPSTRQGIIILAWSVSIIVNTEPVNKTFQNSDRYTLISNWSGNFTNYKRF